MLSNVKSQTMRKHAIISNIPRTIVLLILLFFFSSSTAQNWQWGKSGGGSNNPPSSNSDFTEKVVDMATDANGNVYILSTVLGGGTNVDGIPIPNYGNVDMIVASFNCNGDFRWSKTIGGYANDRAIALKVDRQGHVYVTGTMSPLGSPSQTPIHFDTDTSFGFGFAKTMFLVQYDTSGNFQWLQMPQPDTMYILNGNKYRTIDIETDTAGNVYWFCVLNPGMLAATGNPVITTQAPYILKYNPQGDLVSILSPDIQAGANLQSNFTCGIARDPNSGRFYIAGKYNSGTFSINGQPITRETYVAAFDAQGQFLWKRENFYAPPNNGGFTGKPQIDPQGNIYLCGTSRNGDVFNGFNVVNTMTAGVTRIPIVVKLDSNGNNIWMKNGSANGATYCNAIALTGNEVIITGGYGRLFWPNEDTLYHAANQGYDVWLARFNAQTGSLVKLDSIAGPFGADDHGTALTADANGNIYVGGEYGAQLYVGQDTLLSFGGQTDFFIAKYGNASCGCVSPSASYSFSTVGATPTINFLYTGTSNVDSMRWTFGDGNSATTVNPTHLYPGNGAYTACVKVYNACGVDSSCQTITINCPVPVPSFSFIYAGDTVLFSYTGTTADSIHWDFGDGQSATGSSPSHHYAGDGTYTVCATAYNGCGSEDTCMTVVIMDVEDVYGRAAITVFPNPAKEYLQVVGLKSSCSYKLYNVIGSTVREGVIGVTTGRINLEQLPAGTYLLELRGEDSVMRVKVLKE